MIDRLPVDIIEAIINFIIESDNYPLHSLDNELENVDVRATFINPSIKYQYLNYFKYLNNKTNSNLLSLSLVNRRFNKILKYYFFRAFSFVRNSEFESKLKRKIIERKFNIWLENFIKLYYRDSNPTPNLNINNSFLSYINFLEIGSNDFFKLTNNLISNVHNLKLLGTINGNYKHIIDNGLFRHNKLSAVDPNNNNSHKLSLNYLSMTLGDWYYMSIVFNKVDLTYLKRLDLLIDFKLFDALKDQNDLNDISNLKVFDFFCLNLLKNLVELNLFIKSTFLVINWKFISQFIQFYAQSLQKLSIRHSNISNSLSVSSILNNFNTNDPTANKNFENFEYFFNTIKNMKKLLKLSIDFKLLRQTNLSAYLNLKNHKTIKASTIENYTDFDGLILEIVEPALITPLINEHESLLIKFIKNLPPINTISLVFGKQFNSIYKGELLLLKNLINHLKDHNKYKIQYIQLEFAWNAIDQQYLNEVNSSNKFKINQFDFNGLKLTSLRNIRKIYNLEIPSYSRTDYCSPNFRLPERYKIYYKRNSCDQGLRENQMILDFENQNQELNENENSSGNTFKIQYYELLIDDLNCYRQSEDFWSTEISFNDSTTYSEPVQLSSIWD
ncbi:uncharacterized protein ASCRUDRAFT_76242 [Ascoidea rubescens DSM 1968]|uniref:Uncharacterized protein n=1 Tax=Ascoidea rubescens DSM 1968 TaxID=1344418 RepID=A0A1D2VGU2_9ASCO|nr:hypothetical protein ASCRUDRAFT_76242 [Ascoidea rubescens DSM 1968]ODV60891.1 hypothetical protein ASCRUDRAFT_76242 [Ascoidea rubescens DSM 1968]